MFSQLISLFVCKVAALQNLGPDISFFFSMFVKIIPYEEYMFILYFSEYLSLLMR